MLTWDQNTNSSVVGYKIYYKASSSGAPYNGSGLDQGTSPIIVKNSDISDPSSPAMDLTGFQSGQTYYFAVTAFDAVGAESSYSNEVIFENIFDTVDPEAPTNLIGKELSASNVFLIWNAATDTGGSGLAGYDVYRDGQLVKSTSELGFTDTGLVAETEYRYTVQARDNAGNTSALSNEVIVKTLAESNTAIRVNCGGGNYIDASGRQWLADYGFNTGRSSSYQEAIQRTEDDTLHQTARWDQNDGTELAYGFKVLNGDYRVNLYFSECYPATSKVGARIFSVFLEGVRVIDRMDVFAEAGSATALVKSFDIAVVDGNINLELQHEDVEDPEIAAIEILSRNDQLFHSITASAGNSGTISPQGVQQIAHGGSQTFSISANQNYHISDVLVDGRSIGAQDSYTFDQVDADHTIAAAFAVNTYQIAAQAGAHGTISPTGTLTVGHGGSQGFSITPEEGYHISDVLVNGASVGPVATYTLSPVVSNQSISASFDINTYTITAEAGANGSISPFGKVSIAYGGGKSFTIAANNNFVISDVKVDGQSKGPISAYTFSNVKENHTIAASFASKSYQITAKDCTNGTIDPAGSISVPAGGSKTYTFTPSDGYVLSDVKLDGVSIGAKSTYTFAVVDADHIVEAVFEKQNQAPVADAGPDQRVEEGGMVTLTGYNSVDPDDGIAGFLWEQVQGPKVELTDASGEEARFIAPDVGVDGAALVFKLTVADQAGQESVDTCIVNVTWVNMPPKAVTAPDLTVKAGAEVVLDGSSSSDPDDGIQSYLWVQKSGTPIVLANVASAKATFKAPNVGPQGDSLSFELIVTDQGGLQSSANSIVNITWTNVAPTAEAGPNQIAVEETEVSLDGSNSTDTDDGIAGYSWTQTDGIPVILSDSTAVRPTFMAPNVGPEGAALTFKLTVTDKGGLKSQDNCTVNIGWENKSPVADAGSDMTVKADSLVTLNGSGSSDGDDGIAAYQWQQISGPQVTLQGAGAHSATFTAPDPVNADISLTFQLTVTDMGGLQSKDNVIVNVSWENMPPVADAGEDQRVNSGVKVILNGNKSSDPDDGIVAYQWVQVSGPPVTLSSPKEMSPSFTTPIVIGNEVALRFTLTVTDQGGLQSDDSCSITVEAGTSSDTLAPTVTITTPVKGATYETSDTTLALAGSASDAQGVVKVSWTNSSGGSGVASGTQSWSISGVGLVEGSNVITVTAEDAAGNRGKATLTVTRKNPSDTTAPDLKISSPTRLGFYFTFRSQVDLKGTCYDKGGVEKISWENSTSGSGQAAGTGNWTIAGLTLNKWFNTITVTATDKAGNQSRLNLIVFRWPF